MSLIDTHAHLDEAAFEVDRTEVVARALAAGVQHVITIGTTAESSQRTIAVAAAFPAVYAAVGIQPNYVAEARAGDWEQIEELAASPKVVAIGETGLDRYWDHTPFDLQIDYFQRHLRLAQQFDLPVVIHCREAEADVVAQLEIAVERGPLRGVMHSFTGNLSTAQACLELGMYISIAGMATFKKSDELRAVIPSIPAERLLVETDSPYLAPQPVRGKRNEPAFIVHTARILAELRGTAPDEFARQTTENAQRLFRFPVTPPPTG